MQGCSQPRPVRKFGIKRLPVRSCSGEEKLQINVEFYAALSAQPMQCAPGRDGIDHVVDGGLR